MDQAKNIGKTAILLLLAIFGYHASFSQKMIGDCTIQYKLKADNHNSAARADSNTLKNASKTLYVRGGMSLTVVNFNDFSQSTVYNQNGDKTYVLYHLNGQNYMSVLTNKQWLDQYEKYKGMEVQLFEKDTKKILGYDCIRAVVRLKDGSRIQLYYTPELKTTVCDNPYEFEKIDGLILEFESQIGGKYKFTFTATSIDFNPVPASRFIIPKEGYRLLDPHQLRSEE